MVIQTNRSRRRIARPAGSAPNSADRVVRNCRLVNVLTREIHPADIEISGSRIRRIVGPNEGRGRKALDAAGAFAVPGLMDAHLHTEATLLTLGRFAEAVLPGGTTSFFINPHEIANVLGLRGIQWMLRDAAGLPIRIFLIAPCKVPTAPGLETSGAEFKRLQVREMAEWPGVVAFGEFNGDRLLAGDPRQREILQWVRPDGKILAGHAPGVLGEDVGRLWEMGIRDDHESTTFEEVRDRLRQGMTVFLREGSTERSIGEILPEILKEGLSTDRLCFCTDDKHPDDLLAEGDVDHHVREAIRLGMDPIDALRCATWNCALHYGLERDLGALTPGRLADIVLVGSLRRFDVRAVLVDGQPVFRDGRPVRRPREKEVPLWARRTVKLPDRIEPETLVIKAPITHGKLKARVIEVHPSLPTTRMRVLDAPVLGGEVLSNVSRDVLKIVCVDRHSGLGKAGAALVKGFGLREGALGSSVAHDHHNLVVVGASDDEILTALRHLRRMRGGLVAVRGKKALARLPLPVAGLLSERPVREVVKGLRDLKVSARALGCPLPNPFMTLSFVSLPTIPECGLTDHGLVDARAHEIVPVPV